MTNPWSPWLTAWGSGPAWAGPRQEHPLSGDVSQWLRVFSPTVMVNGRGDPGLEGEIVRDVATYGAQLGPITALVLALADGTPPPAEALTKLREICQEIETKKDDYRQGAADRARQALTELAELDPDATVAPARRVRGSAAHPGGEPVARWITDPSPVM